MDKVCSCYKDGLNGGQDMRSFSGFYFILRIAGYLCGILSHLMKPFLHINRWLATGTLLFFTTLTIAIAKPYRKAYMNYWDIAILSHLTILNFVLSSGNNNILLVARVLLSIPILIFIIAIMLRKGYKSNMCKSNLLQKCCIYFKFTAADVEANRRLTGNTLTEVEPLIQPTFSTCNHGAESKEST
jgi:hypothetical protein